MGELACTPTPCPTTYCVPRQYVFLRSKRLYGSPGPANLSCSGSVRVTSRRRRSGDGGPSSEALPAGSGAAPPSLHHTRRYRSSGYLAWLPWQASRKHELYPWCGMTARTSLTPIPRFTCARTGYPRTPTHHPFQILAATVHTSLIYIPNFPDTKMLKAADMVPRRHCYSVGVD